MRLRQPFHPRILLIIKVVLTARQGGDTSALRMNRWFGKFLCLLTVLAVTDTHLMLLQGWAWGNMLTERAPERGVVEAIDSTLSGAEPCAMCCAVQEERNERQEDAPVPESSPVGKWIPVSDHGKFVLGPLNVRFRGLPQNRRERLVLGYFRPDVPPPQEVG